MKRQFPAFFTLFMLTVLALSTVSCSRTYYGAMEKIGIHKREILVDRVQAGRDAQAKAQKQFQSALEQFNSIVKLEETDLKKAYDKLNREYKKSKEAADNVSKRINKIESVASALFKEWKSELKQYQNQELRRTSERQLETTREHYNQMLASMKNAERSMQPVLTIFHDNVLFLKHNLNAQAIGSLQAEFATLENHIEELIKNMNKAIASSDEFIANIKE